MKNAGKKFEETIKKSIETSTQFIIRLQDPPQSFIQSEYSKFSNQNPCDYILYDSQYRILMLLELKSTKYKSMNFQLNIDDKQNKMIKYHQIESLSKYSSYNGVLSGFLFNFRDEKNKIERTYFQNVIDFNKMISLLEKKSFNEIDLLMNNSIRLQGKKLRVNYIWDMKQLILDIRKQKEGMKHE